MRTARRPVRDAVAACAASAIYSFALGLASVAVPLLAVAAGYSAVEIGVLTAVSAIAQMTSRLGLGRVMRVFPDWVLVAAATAMLAASCAVAALSAAVVPMVAAQLLQGTSRACFWTGSQTHVVRGEGSSVRGLAMVNMVGNIGLLLGPVAGGVLAERSASLALAVGAAVAAAAVVPVLFVDRLPPFVRRPDRPPGMIWRRPGVSAGCWAGVTAGAWRGLLTSYIPLVLIVAGHSSSTVGVLVALANTASLVGSVLVARLDSHGLARAFGLGVLVTGGAVAVTGLVAHSAVLAGLALVASGIGAGGIQTMGPAIASDAVHPQERGEAIAAAGTFRAAALFFAPIAVAGMVAVVPIAAGLAVAGVAIALPASYTPSLRRHLTSQRT